MSLPDPPVLRTAARSLAPLVFELPIGSVPFQGMPVRVVAAPEDVDGLIHGQAIRQVLNVATLPGAHGYAVALPGVRLNHGFPIGTVAGTLVPDGVICPGGIGDGPDGLRLLATGMSALEISVEALLPDLEAALAAPGLDLDARQWDQALRNGSRFVVEDLGLGRVDDLSATESGGVMGMADPSKLPPDALEPRSLGTLRPRHEHAEIQVVAHVQSSSIAEALGLKRHGLAVLLHAGSGALGSRVRAAALRSLEAAPARYGITLPDRELLCAPMLSLEGQAFFTAMCAVANYAWAHRQVLTHRIREAVHRAVGPEAALGVTVVHDVSKNLVRIERHQDAALLVHRKGSTRALGPAHPELPPRYRGVGQPLFLSGGPGTATWVLVATDEAKTISLSSASADLPRGQDPDALADLLTRARIARKVARLEPVQASPQSH